MENILTLYNGHDRQIFIAIDEINNKFQYDIIKLLEDNAILTLTHDYTLFYKDWKNKDTSNTTKI